ncbi:MAG: GatB/YqeY domain-containing protein, partial [Deltaproteobacteria bacterium]|nr:GatB/YqeY domain-containing protein [Deltaproteobacteria bacterium]
FWTEVITRYVKQQKKALVEFEKAGDQGKDGVESLRFEIDYLSPFLPRLKGEDEVRELVKRAIVETGTVGAKMAGRIVGHVMKSHREEVDAGMVKRIATEELG